MSAANRPNINYVTIEDPASGLFKTQVLDLLIHSVKASREKMGLCVFTYPWHLFSKRKCLRVLRNTCEASQIQLHIYPVLIPVKYSLSTALWFHLTMSWLSLVAQLLPKCDIAHCRGYFATFMGIKSRTNSKVIFDMRSSWVDENVAAGRLAPDSNLHLNWLKLEQFCLHSASYTLGVSDAMELIARRGPTLAYETIPIAANAALIGFSESYRNRMRQKFGWEACQVAVYSGSFGLNGINVCVLTRLLGLLGQPKHNLRFLFLTHEDPKLIAEILGRAGIDESAARCFSVSVEMLGNYLSIADFGIHALPAQPDSATRLGTKVVEYWVNGLPTLVTSTVGAAAQIINEFAVGQVVPIDALENNNPRGRIDISELFRKNFGEALKALNTEQFDLQSVTEKYMKVYGLLLQRTARSTPLSTD